MKEFTEDLLERHVEEFIRDQDNIDTGSGSRALTMKRPLVM